MLSLSLLVTLLPAALACAPLDDAVANLDRLPLSYSDALTLAASECSFPDISEATLFVPPASVEVDPTSLPPFIAHGTLQLPLNGTVSTLGGTAHLWSDGTQHIAIGEDWVVASTVQGEGWVAYLLATGDESGEGGPLVDKRAGGGGGSGLGGTSGARGGSSSSSNGGSKGGGTSSGGRTGPPPGSRPASNRPNGVNGVNGVNRPQGGTDDDDGGGGGSDDSGGGSGGSGNKGGGSPSAGSRDAPSAVSGRASSIPTAFRWSSAQGVRASGALLVCAFVLASVLT